MLLTAFFVSLTGTFARAPLRHGPQPLEDVINWHLVVRKYYQMNGIDDHEQEEVEKNGAIAGGKHDRAFNMTEIVSSAYAGHKLN